MHLSPKVNNQASAPFELVHSDVWGPCPVVFPTGFQYFVMFVDDYSRTTWFYLMKYHLELFSHFMPYVLKFILSFMFLFKILEVIMPNNICLNNFSHSCFRMTSFIRHLMLILLKMELLKEKIDSFLKPLELYSFKCMCLSIFGPMLFPQLVFLLIGCLPLS